MIPWRIVNIVAAAVRPLGFEVHVRATQGRRGADRLYLVRPTPPGAPTAPAWPAEALAAPAGLS